MSCSSVQREKQYFKGHTYQSVADNLGNAYLSLQLMSTGFKEAYNKEA